MSKNNYEETLANEIGDLGADTSESTGLGKLKHKEAYGQKADLDDSEQDSLNRFLNKGIFRLDSSKSRRNGNSFNVLSSRLEFLYQASYNECY